MHIGKCSACESFKVMKKMCKTRTDKILIRNYKMFHRNFYMGEKVIFLFYFPGAYAHAHRHDYRN
jgi:hypothetical protein